MVIGASSWTLTPEDERALRSGMERLLKDAAATSALLVDRSGQLLAEAGNRGTLDVTSFATLAAADFSANDQLARLLGEDDFASLYHQGERESILLADVARRAIVVVIFDGRTTLGMVRLRLRPAVEELGQLVAEMERRDSSASGSRPAPFAGADDEIDRLFQ